MGIAILLVALGLIYKKRERIQKAIVGYKNKITNKLMRKNDQLIKFKSS